MMAKYLSVVQLLSRQAKQPEANSAAIVCRVAWRGCVPLAQRFGPKEGYLNGV